MQASPTALHNFLLFTQNLTRDHVTFACAVSLVIFNLEQCLSPFFSSHNLDTLKSTNQLFCGMSFTFEIPCFLMTVF